jgi:hypothetical protein
MPSRDGPAAGRRLHVELATAGRRRLAFRIAPRAIRRVFGDFLDPVGVCYYLTHFQDIE